MSHGRGQCAPLLAALLLAATVAGATGHASASQTIDCAKWNTAEFFRAATAEDVRRCLDQGANPNARHGKRERATPLHHAAMHSRDPDVIHALAAAGAKPMAPAGIALERRSPPSLAAEHNPEPAVLIALWEERNRSEAPRREKFNKETGQSEASAKVLWSRADMGMLTRYLVSAVKHNENEAVAKAILGFGADPNATATDAASVLHHAAKSRSVDLVKTLLKAGADPRRRNTVGETPLHVAARRGDDAIVEVLLGAGSDPFAHDYDGMTPLHAAAKHQHRQAVDRLRKWAGIPDLDTAEKCFTNWREVFASGTREDAETCLAAGAKHEARDDEGLTPVHHAAKNRDAGALHALLSAHANPNPRLRGTWGDSTASPLDVAIGQGPDEAILALLEAGATVEEKNVRNAARYRATPNVVLALRNEYREQSKDKNGPKGLLHEAAKRSEHPAVIRALIAAGEKLSVLNEERRTPFEEAFEHNWNDATVAALLEAGGGPKGYADGTEPPVIRAARDRRSAEVFKWLIKRGANPDARNEKGLNALAMLAHNEGNAETIQVLVEAGAEQGDILTRAARERNAESTRILIGAGLDPTQALLDSANEGDRPAVGTLLEAGADVTNAVAEATRVGKMRTILNLLGAGDDTHVALARAAGHGYGETARMLVKAGADPTSASVWAADLGRTGEVLALVELGASPGEALSRAALSRKTQVIEALVESGVNPDAKDSNGRTALFWAIEYDRAKSTKALIEAGADATKALAARNKAPDTRTIMTLLEAGENLAGVLLRAVSKRDNKCCFADCLITDFSDYFVRWVRGFPTVFRDRRKMGRLAECRTGVGASSGCAAPALRCGPSGDPPPCARLSASMAVSAAFGHGPIARRSVLAGT